MEIAPAPANEARRLEILKQYAILDTEPEAEFDEAARLAAAICKTPIAIVGFIDKDRQWYKAKIGVEGSQVRRDETFCQHAILERRVMEVEDARLDPRFADSAAVTGDMGVRFYAGAPLLDESGAALGTLCVVDSVPKQLTPEQRTALESLARLVVAHMRLRIAHRTLLDLASDVGQAEDTRSGEGRRQDAVNRVAHELRTPLTPMVLQVHLLREVVQHDPVAEQRLQALERNLARLNEAVGHVLAFTATGKALHETVHKGK